jgi:hypothetical protein
MSYLRTVTIRKGRSFISAFFCVIIIKEIKYSLLWLSFSLESHPQLIQSRKKTSRGDCSLNKTAIFFYAIIILVEDSSILHGAVLFFLCYNISVPKHHDRKVGSASALFFCVKFVSKLLKKGTHVAICVKIDVLIAPLCSTMRTSLKPFKIRLL